MSICLTIFLTFILRRVEIHSMLKNTDNKAKSREIRCMFHPGFPSGNILNNHSTTSNQETDIGVPSTEFVDSFLCLLHSDIEPIHWDTVSMIFPFSYYIFQSSDFFLLSFLCSQFFCQFSLFSLVSRVFIMVY